ncbi:unnamed protein product [Meganyctiphanes norvegica]|uniref:Poly [ADP-ribose] polymerase n=1 Tax=Meganyctiphanes norvegica TaxID=48144 RepID=A0AAV2RGY6_MEGNR
MEWKANFTLMKIHNDSSIHTYKIRRLSTDSAALSNSSKATVYDWYFLENNNAWTKYGDIDSTGNKSFTANLSSKDIESNFILNKKSLFKYKMANFEYELDFSKMIQRNISTGKEREVRRRPNGKLLFTYDNANLQYESDISKNTKKIHSEKEREVYIHPHKNSETRFDGLQLNKMENDDIPGYWRPMLETDSMVRVLLTPLQKEYVEVNKLLTDEVKNATVISIHGIQNPFLWRALKNKKDQLLLKYKDEHKLNMQKLFHGTKLENIEQICEQNFDWRLHGTKTGQLFGRGTYFSNRYLQLV